MRFLFVSNYFPPHYIGGYELHCGRVAEYAAKQGHEVRVLTSDFCLNTTWKDPEVENLSVVRALELRYWKDVTDAGYWRREWRDVRRFRREARDFMPDVVVLWNMKKLASGIVMEAQQGPCGVCYHLMDEWITEFQTGNGLPQFWAHQPKSAWGRLVKPVLRGVYETFFTRDVSHWEPQRAALTSKALGELLEKKHVRIPETHVSYITYDPDVFGEAPERNFAGDAPVHFLWAGRLCEGKGLFTTLDALNKLYKKMPEGWSIDFCGPIDAELARESLRPRLENAPWSHRARYLGSLPYDAMPEQYRNHDVFLFTSEVHEGLPGTIIEAFASGMPVIGTLTGGTKDVLRDGENCIVYPMGHAVALAEAMERLIADPELRRMLSSKTARFAREECSNDAVFPKLLDFYANQSPVTG